MSEVLKVCLLLYCMSMLSYVTLKPLSESNNSEDYDQNEVDNYFKDRVISFHNVHVKNNYKEENITFDQSSKPKVDTLNVNTDINEEVVRLEHVESTTKKDKDVLYYIFPYLSSSEEEYYYNKRNRSKRSNDEVIEESEVQNQKAAPASSTTTEAPKATVPDLSFLPPGTQSLVTNQNGQSTLFLGTFQVLMIPLGNNPGPGALPGLAPAIG